MGSSAAGRRFKRLLVLGMDGLDPKLLQEFMDSGDLPNFSGLAERGCFARMATSNPSESPVAWASIATGADAGQHGIFDFIVRRPGTYLPDLSLMRPNPKNVTGAREKMYLPTRTAEGFWSFTSRAGIPTSVIRWPGTFPPEEVRGHMLCGLGTPDLAGRMGKYSFYATAPDPNDEAKEKVTSVAWQGDRIETELLGPPIKGGSASAPMEIVRRGDGVRVRIGKGSEIDLAPRQWSAWIRVTFKLGFLRKQMGIVKLYLDAVAPGLRLFATPVQVDPGAPAFPITYPDEYGAEMCKRQGPFYTQGQPEDTHAVTDGRVDIDAFLAQCGEIAAERERMFDHELAAFRDGVLAFVFDHSDRIQHLFWGTRDGEHPGHDAAFASKYGHVLLDMYREMDRLLGKATSALGDDDGLMVMSDHGFGSFRRSVQLNTWLVQNGYMALKAGKEESAALFRDVDWSGTRAFALGFGSVYINVKGREQSGIVERPGEYDALLTELSEKLPQMPDPTTGGRPVKAVYRTSEVYRGPQTERAPDLIVGFAEGYRASWQMAIGGAPAGEILADNTKQWCGDHLVDPSVVPAIFLASFRGNRSEVRVEDVAPTVLAGMGLDVPEHMTGRALI
ncbi:MAG: alkaline phosphatase family protein [Phycisphaerae bacterium]|nr:alkaline phosphatase family protein [Phycisphaerae bacterium]